MDDPRASHAGSQVRIALDGRFRETSFKRWVSENDGGDIRLHRDSGTTAREALLGVNQQESEEGGLGFPRSCGTETCLEPK